jgi:hypothetical protein
MIADVQSFATAAGTTPAQIWATEQGTALDWVEAREDYKAVRTARAILAALSTQLAVSIHYDTVADGPDTTVHEAGFGLADYNYNMTNSGVVFANLMAMIAGATSYDQIDSSTWTRQITLHMNNGNTKRVVWNTHFPPINIKRTINVVDATGLTVKDMYGADVPYTLNGANVTVLLREVLGPVVITTNT